MSGRAIYQEAIERWGAESQLRMDQEECGELIAAINRFDRERCGPEAVAEEIADVMITCEQAALLVGEGLVARAKQAKLERLKARLAAPEPAHTGDYATCDACDGAERPACFRYPDDCERDCEQCGGVAVCPVVGSAVKKDAAPAREGGND